MVLKYYSGIKDAHLSDMLRQSNIYTENQLVAFSDYIRQDFSYTGRIIGGYIIFYQDRPINNGTHVTGSVAQSIAESEYNSSCTAVMSLAHFRMLIHGLLNKDTNIVPEEAPLIILDRRSTVCMDKNGTYDKHTSHIYRRINFVRNGENCKMQNIVWCEGGLQLAYIATNNVV